VSARTVAKRRGGGTTQDAGGCLVTACRGGECGSPVKHPGVDHREQLAQLRTGLAGAGKLRVVDECLDACTHSNVVIVTPNPAARRAGARPVWLGEVLDADTIAEITTWVSAGGPGNADLPGMLDLREFKPTRRSQRELEH
jgi:hypothetical protein